MCDVAFCVVFGVAPGVALSPHEHRSIASSVRRLRKRRTRSFCHPQAAARKRSVVAICPRSSCTAWAPIRLVRGRNWGATPSEQGGGTGAAHCAKWIDRRHLARFRPCDRRKHAVPQMRAVWNGFSGIPKGPQAQVLFRQMPECPTPTQTQPGRKIMRGHIRRRGKSSWAVVFEQVSRRFHSSQK